MKFLVGLTSLFILANCSVNPASLLIVPDPDLPDEVYTVSYGRINVSGIAWTFEDDGNYVNFGGPFGGRVDGMEIAVSVEGVELNLETVRDVLDADKRLVERIIWAADQYCVANGLVKSGSVHINTDGRKVHLVQFCAPQDGN